MAHSRGPDPGSLCGMPRMTTTWSRSPSARSSQQKCRSHQVKIRALSVLLAALAAAGCATSGLAPAAAAGGSSAADRLAVFGTGEALLGEAETLMAAATPSSLLEGIRLASAADALGAAGGAGAGLLGDALLRGLYSTPKGGFSGTGLSWKAARITSPFLSRIAPALVLLDPSAAVDQAGATELRARLAEASARRPSSPLPPFFLSLLAQRRSGTLAEARGQLEEALRRSPSFAPAAAELARTIIQSGSAASELALLRHLASLLPTRPRGLQRWRAPSWPRDSPRPPPMQPRKARCRRRPTPSSPCCARSPWPQRGTGTTHCMSWTRCCGWNPIFHLQSS